MLLAIDASTCATGFCFGGPQDAAPRGGIWQLPGADESVFDRTLSQAAESVALTAHSIKAEWVAIEAPLYVIDRFHSAAAASALIQLTGAIRAAAHRAGCKVMLVSVQSARKHFIGTARLPGHEAKQAVMKQCRLLGWQFKGDHNLADSMAVWSFGMALRYPAWAARATPLFAAGRRS